MTTTTATTITPPNCPAWCVTDHSTEAARQNPAHMSSLLDTADDEGHAQVQLVYVETPAPRPKDDYGVFVEVSQDRALSPAEARNLARIILESADKIDEVFPA